MRESPDDGRTDEECVALTFRVHAKVLAVGDVDRPECAARCHHVAGRIGDRHEDREVAREEAFEAQQVAGGGRIVMSCDFELDDAQGEVDLAYRACGTLFERSRIVDGIRFGARERTRVFVVDAIECEQPCRNDQRDAEQDDQRRK